MGNRSRAVKRAMVESRMERGAEAYLAVLSHGSIAKALNAFVHHASDAGYSNG